MTLDIIVDLDGTLCNIDHRLHWVKSKPTNWKAFFAGVPDDEVVEPIKQLINYAYGTEEGAQILLCSGRNEETRQDTETWLTKHHICYTELLMRPKKDYREDSIVKKEMLDKLREMGYNPTIAIDDRNRVVDMWRENGLICLHCIDWRKGDF